MLIGILQAGHAPEGLGEKHGSYPEMFERLIKGAEPSFRFKTYVAVEGEVPGDPRACDAWLITGSRHGVYDRLAWMAPLGELIRAAMETSVPVVGICFGHQIVADALGGTVEKSAKGWGVGIHSYLVSDRPDWLKPDADTFAINAVHQDQVVVLPEGARVLAHSDFCPNAMIAYGDRAFTIQGHPEFENAFARDLIDTRLSQVAPEDVLNRARKTLTREPDSALVARWIAGFLKHAIAARAGLPSAVECGARPQPAGL